MGPEGSILTKFLWSVALFIVGLVLWYKTKDDYEYWTNTYWAGIFPFPGLPAWGIIMIVGFGLATIMNLFRLLGFE